MNIVGKSDKCKMCMIIFPKSFWRTCVLVFHHTPSHDLSQKWIYYTYSSQLCCSHHHHPGTKQHIIHCLLLLSMMRWCLFPEISTGFEKREGLFFASALNRFTRIIISLPEEIQATELFSSCPSVHFHRHHQGSHALYANEMSCNGTLLPLSHSGMLNIVHSLNTHTHAL